MHKRDPLSDGAARQSLPFLPTLAMAAILGAGSLLCREPAPAAAVPAPAVDAQAFHAPAPPAPAVHRPPAALAFGTQFPLTVPAPEPRALASAAPHPAGRVAAATPSLRRPCTGQRCPEAAPRRADPFTAARPAEPERMTVQATEEAEAQSLLPDLALPFAPAVRVVGEAATLVRTGATSLGGSVSILVDRLR